MIEIICNKRVAKIAAQCNGKKVRELLIFFSRCKVYLVYVSGGDRVEKLINNKFLADFVSVSKMFIVICDSKEIFREQFTNDCNMKCVNAVVAELKTMLGSSR